MQRTAPFLVAVAIAVVGLAGAAHAQDPEAGEGEPAAEVAEGEPAAEVAEVAEGEPAVAPAAAAVAPADGPPAVQAELMAPAEAQQALAERSEMTDADKAAYAAMLRQYVATVRDSGAIDAMAARIEDKQASKMDTLSLILSLIACGGVLLLFMPFVLRKRYPGMMGRTFKYSALAALLFFLAVNLFSVVLFTMRGTQAALGRYTNPQLKIVDASLDLIDDKAEDLAEVGPILIEPTLAGLSGDTDEPILSIMLGNVQRLKEDVTVFTSVKDFFTGLDWLFGLLPMVLMGVAIFLFLKVARPTLIEIVRLPERAAQGEQGLGRRAVKETLRNVWNEAKATFCVVGVLIVLTLMAGLLLGSVLQPAIEIFMAYLSVAFVYVQITESASSFWILYCLMASVMFLVLNLAVILVASTLFLIKSQKVFQQRFRNEVPLRRHARLWTWGAAGALWMQVLPLLYIMAALPAIGWLVERSMDKFVVTRAPGEQNWGFVLASGPTLFIVTFVLVFWLFRGFKAIGMLATYKVEGEAVAAVGQVEQAFVATPQTAS